ncbi:MAG: radical SAM protein [Thermodesulfobacteriota bacterium]
MTALNHNEILFIHPLGYPSASAARDISRIANIMPPLGLASLSSYLDERKIKSRIIDCYAHPRSDRLIRDSLITRKPAAMGLSCTTSGFPDGLRIAALGKSLFPDLRVIFGGPHASALKGKLLEQFPLIDFLVIGEGEEPLVELMEGGFADPSSVKGVVYRNRSGEAIFTGHRSDRLNLDSLPFPAYEKLIGFPDTYALPIFNYPKSPNTSCISSRGCPYSCSYCDRSVFRKSFRFNSAEYLYEHLRYLRSRFKIRHVNFYDDLFTFNRERVHQLTRLLTDHPLGITFNCAVRAEHVDKELLFQMKEAGCWMISLGIETGDELLLSRHRSNSNLKRLAETILIIKKAGIRVKGLLMMGLPGETLTSIQKSREFVFSLPLDDINLSKFTPFPGSPIYDRIHEYGDFQEDWEKMDCMHFVFIPDGMTKTILEKEFKRFYKQHFTQIRTLLGYGAMIWRSPDSWIRFIRHFPQFIRFAGSDSRMGAELNP